MGRIFAGKPLSCAVNPSVGREARYAIKRAYEQKRVIIAGGGVAGLEAARTAALRGHLVTLYEKTDLLGGHLISGSIPMFKKDLRSLLSWYESEVFDLGVEIRKGYELTPEVIETAVKDIPDLGRHGLKIDSDIGEKRSIVFDGCLGDSVCVAACPENALDMDPDEAGYRLTIDLARCDGVACRRCERACSEKWFDLVKIITATGDNC